MRKILVIEDDENNREIIQQILADRFQVITAQDGEEGLEKARVEQPDVIVLDIVMPKMDGIAACEILRKEEMTRHIPIIILTGIDDLDQRVRAFATGADDFLLKPFKAKELVARIDSKLRRVAEREDTLPSGAPAPKIVDLGNLSLNLDKIEASIDGKAIRLSVLEFNLLKYFVLNPDRVIGRDEILQHIWKDTVVSDRTVDTHLANIRKKLVGATHGFVTMYGAGYTFKELPKA